MLSLVLALAFVVASFAMYADAPNAELPLIGVAPLVTKILAVFCMAVMSFVALLSLKQLLFAGESPLNGVPSEEPYDKSLWLRFMIWLQERENQTAYNIIERFNILYYRILYKDALNTINSRANVDEYRQQFKRAPLGRWTESPEWSPAPSDTWEFYVDGTGKIFQDSSGESNTVQFEWQEHADFTIRFRITDWGELPEDEDDEETDEETDEVVDHVSEEWSNLQYDFKTIDYYGGEVVMYEVPEQDGCKFWLTTDYLHFVGDISPAR